MLKLFKIMYQSFFSRELYYNAAHSWKGAGFKYLSYMAVLAAIACAVALFGIFSNSSYSNFKTQLSSQMPAASITNGVLTIDKPSPYHMRFDDTDETLTVDTSPALDNKSINEITSYMQANKMRILVMRTRAISLKSDAEMRIYSYPVEDKPISFTREDFNEMLGIVEVMFIPLAAFFIFGFIFIYKMLQVLIYSLFAQLINKVVKVPLDYNALLRITVCAIMPATVFGFVLFIMGSGLPFILSFACTLVFIFFGLKSASGAEVK